jgi:hypothetical protein
VAQSNGGVNTTSRLTLFPMFDIRNKAVGFYAFDPSGGFNDPNSGGFYSFKVEEIIPGRVPTVRKIIAVYRDLGLASASFSLSGTNDQQQVVGPLITPVLFGNLVPTGKLMTKLIDIQITAMNLQLTIGRLPNGGPLSFAKIILCGNVEVAQEF